MATYCYPYKRGTGYRSQGFRTNPGGNNPPGGHTGFDQAMDAGTPIYSPADGIVRNSGWLTDNYMANDWWLTRMGGDILVIDATDAFGRSDTEPTFIIAHLQDSIAEVGARVKKGQLVGISGNSGTATTGAHAHIEALPPNWDWNNGVYGRVDPELYFTEYPEDITVQSAPANKEWYLMPEIPHENLLQIAAAVNNKAMRGDIVKDVLAAPILSTDGKKWPLSAHVQGNTARTVEALARIAGLEELVKQVAAGAGTEIDYARIEASFNKSLAENTVKVAVTVEGATTAEAPVV